MNVRSLQVTQEAARLALIAYKAHRSTYDKRDWEIERIYRAIAKGKVVVAALQAIREAGVDQLGRPKLAIMRADQEVVRCSVYRSDRVTFTNEHRSKASEWHFEIPWRDRITPPIGTGELVARLPRIPPQHRPAQGTLPNYHLLWEADWGQVPRDPMLLKRIGRDAWVVLAAWDLTDVELSVLRAHTATV